MNQYSVLIIGDDPEGQLQPFSKEIEAERPWVAFTFEHKKWERREAIRRCKQLLDRPSPDRDPVKARHLLEELRSQTDREYYEDYAACFEHRNERGEPLTTENPDGWWSRYELGGRWEGILKLKEGRRGTIEERHYPCYTRIKERRFLWIFTDQAKFEDIDWESTVMQELFQPFACLRHGRWHARGKISWLGFPYAAKTETEWIREFDALLTNVSDDTLVSLYDCYY